MNECIIIGNRIEALKAIEKDIKINKIYTCLNSFIDKKYKNRSIISHYSKQNYKQILRDIYNSKSKIIFSIGFNYIIPKNLLNPKKIYINSHPGIINKNYNNIGYSPIKQNFKNNIKYYGVHVHYINENLDKGIPIHSETIKLKYKKLENVYQYIFRILEPKTIKTAIKKLNLNYFVNNKFYIGGEFTNFNKFIKNKYSKNNKNIDLFSDGTILISGRSALIYLLKHLDIDKNKLIYVPAFICESVIDSLNSNGYKIKLYDVSLNNFIRNKFQKNSVVIIIHYYGVKNQLVEEIKNLNVTLIEDYTHFFLNTNIKNISNKNIFMSLRKFSGLPFGGWLNKKIKTDNKLSDKIKLVEDKIYKNIDKKQNYFNDKYFYSYKEEYNYIKLSKYNEQILKKNYNKALIFKNSLQKNLDYDWNFIKKKRRENWKYLHKKLKNKFTIFPKKLNNNICPTYFIIFTKNREIIRNDLINKRIFIPNPWKRLKKYNYLKLKNSEKLFDTFLPIPIDQRLTKFHMDIIIQCLNYHV